MNITNSGVLREVTEEDIELDGAFHIPAVVTRVGNHAFHNCGKLITLTIPDEVWFYSSTSARIFDCCHV